MSAFGWTPNISSNLKEWFSVVIVGNERKKEEEKSDEKPNEGDIDPQNSSVALLEEVKDQKNLFTFLSENWTLIEELERRLSIFLPEWKDMVFENSPLLRSVYDMVKNNTKKDGNTESMEEKIKRIEGELEKWREKSIEWEDESKRLKESEEKREELQRRIDQLENDRPNWINCNEFIFSREIEGLKDLQLQLVEYKDRSSSLQKDFNTENFINRTKRFQFIGQMNSDFKRVYDLLEYWYKKNPKTDGLRDWKKDKLEIQALHNKLSSEQLNNKPK
eukprot:TRINITY_DN594_c0_g1_i2.p2 TRINITY_DN594_c0_g1~~TRINITY_DN594_c0_g1_i2.p2  ORF type:complete len:276 (-),score=108.39 TRINITY_DN594_c0_g1_i2:11-838(-)